VRENQPKFLSKAELRDAARRELKVSKNAFDFAWIQVIEETRVLDRELYGAIESSFYAASFV
jgi:hypothetical protein